MIEFGPWRPKLASVGAPNLRVAKGCTPGIEAYEPFQGLSVLTDALDGRCIGAVTARDIDQAAHMFAGDSTKLYKLGGFAWADVSNGSYGPASDATRWRFATFGDRLVAVNGLDVPQKFDMSSDSAFDDLSGSPPAAQYVTSFSEFLVLGAVATSGMTIKWSAFGDSESWTPGTDQSDEQEFADGGRLTGLGALDVCYIFQEKAIRRMNYVGGAVIMDIQKIIDGIGCVEPNSLVQFGRLFFFLAEDGFSMFDGANLTPIGSGGDGGSAFDDWFRDNSTRAYWQYMSAAIDPVRKIVCWSFPSSGAGTVSDTMLIYNWASGRASYVDTSLQLIVSAASLGISPDDMTSTNVDAMTVSFDDPIFLGGAYYFAGFDTAGRMGSFTGPNVAAEWVTGDMSIGQGRASVKSLKLIADTDAAVLSGSGVMSIPPDDAPAFTNGVATQPSGWAHQRNVNGAYLRAKAQIPAGTDWSFAKALDFKVKAGGQR